MNIHNNYSLANCTKNFMTFCAKFLLTRQIVCAILEPQIDWDLCNELEEIIAEYMELDR